MKDKLINFIWNLGIRAFRLTRKANLSSKLEPVFTRFANLIPTTKQDVAASLPNGAKLWMPAGYRDTRTVVTGLFQRDETKLFQRLTRPGMTFVDVGAYVGYFTILASGLVGASGRVYAFEPDGFAYEYLVRNIHSNHCVNVVAINRAASASAGSVALMRDPRGPESFITNAPFDGASLMAETVTLDSFVEGEGWPTIDVVKMNIEGSELPALIGMREVSRRNPGLQLIMEFNPTAMQRAGVSREELAATLVQLGFRRGQVVERDLSVISGGDLLPKGSAVYNILLTKSDS